MATPTSLRSFPINQHNQEYFPGKHCHQGKQSYASSRKFSLLVQNPQIGQGNKSITIDEVRLEEEGPAGDTVVILFRESGRQHCVFGFRVLAHEPTPQLLPDGRRGEIDDAEGWAFVIMVNLREHLEAADMDLPGDCDANGITWVT